MNRFRVPVLAALALAFASFGDAFLYSFLPVNAPAVGVPIAWVGVLLSINRFVRLFANHWVVILADRFGFRKLNIAAAILAVFATAGYGLGLGVFVWLIVRILWGLAFSMLRISSLSYALECDRPGMALGISKSVYEMGPVLALLLGPWLLEQLTSSATFFLLAVGSVPAIYFAVQLPELQGARSIERGTIFQMPTTFNVLTLLSAFAVEGMLVVLLGALLLQFQMAIDITSATVLAAAYLVFRHTANICLAPIGGWLADRAGFEKIFLVSVFFLIIGIVILVTGWISAGLILLFMFNSVNVATAPGGASENAKHKVTAVATNATWRDMGAAVGALIGGFLLTSNEIISSFILLSLVMVAVLVKHTWIKGKYLKQLMIWK